MFASICLGAVVGPLFASQNNVLPIACLALERSSTLHYMNVHTSAWTPKLRSKYSKQCSSKSLSNGQAVKESQDLFNQLWLHHWGNESQQGNNFYTNTNQTCKMLSQCDLDLTVILCDISSFTSSLWDLYNVTSRLITRSKRKQDFESFNTLQHGIWNSLIQLINVLLSRMFNPSKSMICLEGRRTVGQILT